LRKVKAALGALSPNYSAQLFSSPKRIGMDEVGEVVGRWLGVVTDDGHKRAPVKGE
jgi:hypothetical protein